MKHHTTRTKIEKFIEINLLNDLEKLFNNLVNGSLYEFECELHKKSRDIYNYLSEQLIELSSIASLLKQKREMQELGCRNFEERTFKFRLSTGHRVKGLSLYSKKVPEDWNFSRHSLVNYWKIIGTASPGLYDRVGFCAALGPSYDIGHQLLSKFGTDICLSSVRDINNKLADYCYIIEEQRLSLKEGESLDGKRVVISLDGGRTRTREYDGQINESGNRKFETKWKEPKLFVIDILDELGQPAENELPIYGCRFEEKEILNLLKKYLKKLEIKKANSIQIIGDGAPWIWNNIKEILIELEVDEPKIIETLDYYHASSYVYELIEQMPLRVEKEKRKTLLKKFKNQLWNGNSNGIVKKCKEIYKRPNKLIKRYLKYLEKHYNKMQYVEYQRNSLMCGSGIIESAIRRIINLRFKNASTFWDKETVEKLFFLRGILLSKRWPILMTNLVY